MQDTIIAANSKRGGGLDNAGGLFHASGLFRSAFTLAEVLITLGIIGVVAAMTLPAIVNKYKERETVTKVKKFYSVMNQALLLAIKDNGYVDEWNFLEHDIDTGSQISDKFASYFKPYLKILKDCGQKSGCIAPGTYKLLDNSDWNDYNTSWYYKMILADGSYMWMRACNTECNSVDAGTTNACGLIWFDINGKKEPNIIGKDVFVFVIKKNSILPHQYNDCEIGKSGWSCSKYILEHDNMNYLH